MDAEEELRQRADEVLGQPKFAGSEPGPLARAVEWFFDFINDLLSIAVNGTAFGGVAIGWIILAVMVGLIAYFLIRFMPGRRLAIAEKARADVETTRNRLTRAEWLAEAERATSVGQHREAVRARYRATVAGLVERDELPNEPGTTPAEMAKAFQAESIRRDPFASSTGAFSDVWYGGANADRSDDSQVAEWDAAVMGEQS